MLTDETLDAIGLDGIALKPSECDLSHVAATDADLLVVDYEGHEHVPDGETLASLAEDADVRVTTPVRADGFDPLGDDTMVDGLPRDVGRVLVAGHPAYLTATERRKAVAPRLGRARERAPGAWVGTEGVERLALATGATQFELLSAGTQREVRALRAAGFDGEVAVYAPTVLSAETDAILDAVGAYAARREPVATRLPDGAAADATATGDAREVLERAVEDYALVGEPSTVSDRIEGLREAGVDRVVGYPARGPERLLG